MTQEDYISFGVAKLLKEKGFEGRMHTFYTEEGTEIESAYVVPSNFFPIYRPTLQMAMKWLREVYNIHIEVRYFPLPNIYRYVIIHTTFTRDNIDSHPQYFNSYEEACEAAIKYCLENLI